MKTKLSLSHFLIFTILISNPCHCFIELEDSEEIEKIDNESWNNQDNPSDDSDNNFNGNGNVNEDYDGLAQLASANTGTDDDRNGPSKNNMKAFWNQEYKEDPPAPAGPTETPPAPSPKSNDTGKANTL